MLSGVVMVALALGTAFVGGPVFSVFWLLASAAVLWEWQNLIDPRATGLRFAIGAAALAVVAVLVARHRADLALIAIAAGAGGTAVAAASPIRAASGLGVVYAAAPLWSVGVLRSSVPAGLEAILWLFAVVWGTDIMAYFGGRMVGGARLWPRLSPGKTWSGFLVGIGCGALAGLLVRPAEAPIWPCLMVGLLAGALAQGGDLFESALKRRYNVKDASRLIPGHGGVMDRLDGFIAAATFAACLGVARFGADAAGTGLFVW